MEMNREKLPSNEIEIIEKVTTQFLNDEVGNRITQWNMGMLLRVIALEIEAFQKKGK